MSNARCNITLSDQTYGVVFEHRENGACGVLQTGGYTLEYPMYDVVEHNDC
jgi:hypothetical protein